MSLIVVNIILLLNRQVKAEILVDLKLILALDVSGSVDDQEFSLQARGLANAFRDPTVEEAIGRAGKQGIAVAVIQWSGPDQQEISISWTHLTGKKSLLNFSDQLGNLQRSFDWGNTLIGRALTFSGRLLSDKTFYSERNVIDVSGDGGVETIGMTKDARDSLVGSSIIINGLAIENEVEQLAEFYRRNVIGGKNSFVLSAANYTDFAFAIPN